jgi:hypothetical protein
VREAGELSPPGPHPIAMGTPPMCGSDRLGGGPHLTVPTVHAVGSSMSDWRVGPTCQRRASASWDGGTGSWFGRPIGMGRERELAQGCM